MCIRDRGRAFAMLLNVLFARVPMVVMVLRHTTTIRASITAYSTAVGPSSDFRKRCTFKARFFIVPTPQFANDSGISGSARETIVTTEPHSAPQLSLTACQARNRTLRLKAPRHHLQVTGSTAKAANHNHPFGSPAAMLSLIHISEP